MWKLVSLIVTAGGWALWAYTVLFLDPSIPMAPVVFYVTLFVALTGTLSSLLDGGGFRNDSDRGRSPSLGHGAAVATLILFAMWLQSLRMLTPFSGGLLAATLFLIEAGFFLAGGRRRARQRRRPRRDRGTQTTAAGQG